MSFIFFFAERFLKLKFLQNIILKFFTFQLKILQSIFPADWQSSVLRKTLIALDVYTYYKYYYSKLQPKLTALTVIIFNFYISC